MNSLGEVIETARRACGMTQGQLAEQSGVTHAALSRYEHDLRVPNDESVALLERALGLASGAIRAIRAIEGANAIDAHMRRQQTAQATVWRQLEARLNMYRFHTASILEEVSLTTTRTVPTFDPVVTDAETAARLCRMQWKMPSGPVRNLIRWVEAAGCIVIEEDFGTGRIDGLSQWINDIPIMLLNVLSPPDRKRLTVAHELGHLTMHRKDVSDDVEADANGFAAEFLMPAEVIRSQMRNLTVGKLHDLKREWGVSMQALIERAFGLGLISSSARTDFYKTFSHRGWRKVEPLSDQMAVERPELAAHIGQTLRSRGLTDAEIATVTRFAIGRSDNPFLPSRIAPHLRSVG